VPSLPAASASPRPARHARRPESHRIARGIALTVTALLAFGVTGAATAYTRLQGNIKSADVVGLLGASRPKAATVSNPNDPNAGQALNILLIGSDVRTGQDAAIGGAVAGMRSDTTIVLHLSADRKRADLVSIPRDTLVDIPSCARSNGSSSKPQKSQFNTAFSVGSESGKVSDAAACTIKTVEKNTGVRIDDYVVIDFAGFIKMVDALGGVPICIPNKMVSPKAGLVLKAGQQTLNGATALGYARARTGTGVGDGSDTNRIGRQQQLLAAMVRDVQSQNLLTDMPKLLRFLGAATSSITASPSLASIPNLTGLAFSLRGTSSANITFLTIPFAAAPSDPNRVVMTSAAKGIWANVAADQPIAAAATPGPSPTTTPGATTAPGSTAAPTPTATKRPGKDAITAETVTAVCG
jgi:LCP family protein required for cell wall assembly